MDWQLLITIAIIVAAAAYVAVRVWRTVFRRAVGGCGSCASCPASGAETTKTDPAFVPVEQLRERQSGVSR